MIQNASTGSIIRPTEPIGMPVMPGASMATLRPPKGVP
jgi:hypothetical protein